LLVLLISWGASQVPFIFVVILLGYFDALKQFDWHTTPKNGSFQLQNKTMKRLWKLPKIKVYMWRCKASLLAHLYRWKGDNFGQTIWDKIEDYY
jgi:hypothetical protein